MIAEMNLVIWNDGKIPTFQRGQSYSFIDVTLATQDITRDLVKWEVLEAECMVVPKGAVLFDKERFKAGMENRLTSYQDGL
nr:unnamed protein product [Callosobruchus analis]